MRKTYLIVTLFFLALLAFVIHKLSEGTTNLKNSYRVKVGMGKQEAFAIMDTDYERYKLVLSQVN